MAIPFNEWIPGCDYMHLIGSSTDGRTNRWRIICPICGRKIEPPTTMLRFQTINCEKCEISMDLDFNLTTIKVWEK